MPVLSLNTSKPTSTAKFKVGKHNYGSIAIDGHHLLDTLEIGSFCAIGPRVELVVEGWSHNVDWISTYPFEAFSNKWSNAKKIQPYLRTKRSLKIGNDVWIGRNVSIMSDVTIGDGAVIGANTMVTKDIPPYSIAVGNSMRILKKRFSDEDIQFLLELKWWDWPDSKINEHLEIINSGNIEALKKVK